MSRVRLFIAIGAAACGTTGRVPTPSGVLNDAGSVVVYQPAAPPASPEVRFIKGMIPHHGQALAMTALVPARSRRDDIRLIAQRIERSQKDEIAAMQRWLRRRGQAVPPLSGDPHHAHGAAGSQSLMPGMLTHEELMQLEEAAGTAFDRLFLERMIRHHEGALTMVKELFGTPGATQDPELYQLASDVDADQRAEINRMQTLLRDLR